MKCMYFLTQKKWILMIPWMFSEFFRQLIFLALYGFIIYSSIPVITATRVEDNIGNYRRTYNDYLFGI